MNETKKKHIDRLIELKEKFQKPILQVTGEDVLLSINRLGYSTTVTMSEAENILSFVKYELEGFTLDGCIDNLIRTFLDGDFEIEKDKLS